MKIIQFRSGKGELIMEKLVKGSIDINDLMDYYNNKDENKKHLKGYIFDSLVYRYQLARFTQADYEARAKGENIQQSRDRAVRDIMRFVQILDEAIGEHD